MKSRIYFIAGLIVGTGVGFLIDKPINPAWVAFDIAVPKAISDGLRALGYYSPDPVFLSDITAFSAAIIAFFVPLSIDIIAKLSERYRSEVIVDIFEDSVAVRSLPFLLMANILAAICLRFFVPEKPTSGVWVAVAWVMLIYTAIVAFFIVSAISRVKKVVRDRSFVMEQLYQRVIRAMK